MGVIVLKDSLSTATDSKSLSFVELTGVYSSANTGGYGTPNINTSDATAATLSLVLSDGSTVNFASTFYPLFPNTSYVRFGILNTDLGFASDQAIPDQIPLMTYTVVDDDLPATYVLSKYVFIDGQSRCCIQKMLSKIKSSGDCSCGNKNYDAWVQATALYSAIQGALDCTPQRPNDANRILTLLTDLCSSAGCGCS